MKDFFDLLSTRIKSPFWGYFILATISWNWDSYFFLLFDNGLVIDRISYFQTHTDTNSLLIKPLITAVLLNLIYPWISVAFTWCLQKPTQIINYLQIKTKHQHLIEQQKLEKAQSKLDALDEEKLIAQAKRDEQVEDIENEETREKLKQQLETLRKENKNLQENIKASKKPTDNQIEILKNISNSGGIYEGHIFQRIPGSQTKKEYDLETLKKLGYIEFPASHNGDKYILSYLGKSYLVDNDLI